MCKKGMYKKLDIIEDRYLLGACFAAHYINFTYLSIVI